MRRVITIFVLVAGVLAIVGYQQLTDLEVVSVTPDVHVIVGNGGNVGVLATERGPVVVDTLTFRMLGARVRELAERLAGGPVQSIVNTHYHPDHTHGNPGFAVGTRVVATSRTLAYLKAFDTDSWSGAAAGTLPNETFDESHVMRLGGKTIELHHFGAGHTGGDLVVLFVEDRVLHAGDLFFNGRYPNIDLEAGGSVEQWGDTLDRVLALDFDQVIPGHGPVTDRAGLEAFQRFVRELWREAQDAARKGKGLTETLASTRLEQDEGYEAVSIPFVMKLDRDFVVRRAWEEAMGTVKATPLDGD